MNRIDDLYPDGDAGNPGRDSQIAGVASSLLHHRHNQRTIAAPRNTACRPLVANARTINDQVHPRRYHGTRHNGRR